MCRELTRSGQPGVLFRSRPTGSTLVVDLGGGALEALQRMRPAVARRRECSSSPARRSRCMNLGACSVARRYRARDGARRRSSVHAAPRRDRGAGGGGRAGGGLAAVQARSRSVPCRAAPGGDRGGSGSPLIMWTARWASASRWGTSGWRLAYRQTRGESSALVRLAGGPICCCARRDFLDRAASGAQNLRLTAPAGGRGARPGPRSGSCVHAHLVSGTTGAGRWPRRRRLAGPAVAGHLWPRARARRRTAGRPIGCASCHDPTDDPSPNYGR